VKVCSKACSKACSKEELPANACSKELTANACSKEALACVLTNSNCHWSVLLLLYMCPHMLTYADVC
jgi:hypothetical protein